ncbi:MAG: hypothetical protein LC720_06985 [Actinobacteria bacterium]|nr:hypothetical protein [Actinomycetota bacterium]
MEAHSIAIARRPVSLLRVRPGRAGLGLAGLGVLAFSFTFPATTLALRGFDAYVVPGRRPSSGSTPGREPWWSRGS